MKPDDPMQRPDEFLNLLSDARAIRDSVLGEERFDPEQIRYEVGEILGRGGCKTVYRTVDRQTGRGVAYAEMNAGIPASMQRLFRRESRILANLDHPNIVHIYETGTNGRVPYFTMQYVEGQTFADALDSFTVDERLAVFCKICDAISYAHSRGVIHADLKPDNILVGAFGEVAVCDWGIAQIHDDDCDAERSILDDDELAHVELAASLPAGQVRGSPGFLAPEQVGGSAATKYSDVYGLGAMLYVALTGELPVEGVSASGLFEATRDGKVVAPTERNQKIPVSLEAVCMKAMAVDPQDRYPSVVHLLRDVNRYRSGYTTAAEDASLGRVAWRFMQRHRFVCSLIATFLLVMAVGGVGFVARLTTEQRATMAALEALRTEESKRRSVSEDAAKRYYDKAREAFERIRFEEAAAYNAASLQLDPNHEDSRIFAGWLALYRHDFDGAREFFGGGAERRELVTRLDSLSAETPIESIHALISEVATEPYPRSYLRYRLAVAETPREQLDVHAVFLRSLVKNKHLDDGFTIGLDEVDGLQVARYCNDPELRAVGGLKHVNVDVLDFTGSTLHSLVLPDETFREIDLSNTKIGQLSGLRHAKIDALLLRKTNVVSLDAVTNCGIRRLDLRQTKIDPIRAMRSIKTLRHLRTSVAVPDKVRQSHPKVTVVVD